MKVIPAVDVERGVAVKRVRGASRLMVLGDPLRLVDAYASWGFEWVHIVDLDAAERGRPTGGGLSVVQYAARQGLRVEYGGGVRSAEAADMVCSMGVDRVVVGTGWLMDPGLLGEVSERCGSVLAAVEVNCSGRLVVHGWTVEAGLGLGEALAMLSGLSVDGVFYTDVCVEGLLGGVDAGRVAALRRSVDGVLVYAGGVASPSDLRILERAGVDAVVVGRALYEGFIDPLEAARLG